MTSIPLIIKTFLLLLAFLIVSCNTITNKPIVVNEKLTDDTNRLMEFDNNVALLDSVALQINFKPKGNYVSITTNITTDKAYFKSLYQIDRVKAIDSASHYLYFKLLNDIVPHWYGTEWDFNGHTNTPNDGEIACGYFVSTTLKHLGFNLNRYKMAQQAGLLEARMLQHKNELKIYSGVSFETLKQKVNAVYSDGIYFVGLDNHVGYVLVKDKELYFLHSSYCDDKVVLEPAKTSACFSSNMYVFAEITTNKKLLTRWISNERLNVPTN